MYFGIDIWAQNRPHSFLHPRLTWPLLTGGGTNTGFAVKKCAEMGVSAGLFAPGWCWEHFSSSTDRRKVEESLWRGVELEGSVVCECKPRFWGGDVHRTKEYFGNGVTRWAEEGMVGSENGFWTGFEKAIEVVSDGSGGKRMVSRLGAQGIMPVPNEDGEKGMRWVVDDDRPGILSIVAAEPLHGETGRRCLKLYNLGVGVEEDTRLMVRYRRPGAFPPLSIAFLIKTHSSSGETEEVIPLPVANFNDIPFSYKLCPTSGRDAAIIEVGIVLIGPLRSHQEEILQLSSLSIGSSSSFPSTSLIQVTNIQLKIQGRDEWKHGRLTWSVSRVLERPSKIEDWSRITGPAAYFEIGIDGAIIGRAYGLEFVLPDVIVERWRSDGVVAELCGVLFGGTRLRKVRVELREKLVGDEDELQLVVDGSDVRSK